MSVGSHRVVRVPARIGRLTYNQALSILLYRFEPGSAPTTVFSRLLVELAQMRLMFRVPDANNPAITHKCSPHSVGSLAGHPCSLSPLVPLRSGH